MKKIFYFIASAIVALGAVACQNQFDDEFTPNTQNEGLSFTAAIDEDTRITFNGAVTSWEAGDCIMINGYEFICTNGSSFSCTADGVRSLIGQEIEAVYSYNKDGYVDSKQAEKGAVLKATGTMQEANTTLTFSPQSAYLNFTSMQGNVVLYGKGLFVVDGATVDTFTVENKYGAQYVAINPTNEEIEFSYTYGGEPGKTIQKKFVAGNVYKLGTLSAPVAEVDGVRYTDLSKALTAAGTTKVVTLLANATVSQPCVINANNFTLETGDGFLALKNYNNANGYYDVVAVTEATDCAIPGTHNSWDIAANGVYIINGTSLRVAPNVAMDANNEFKFYLLNWDRAKGATTQNAITVNSKLTAGGNNIKVGTKGTYDLYLNGNVAFYVANQETNNKNILSTLGASTGDLFLNFNGQDWAASNATIAAYYYGGPSEATFVKMTDTNSDGIYECTAPADDYTHIIFVRLSEDTLNWDKKWNQTPGDSKVALKGAGSLGILTAYEQVEIVY